VKEIFFTQATSTSQNINLSYGYLWWLNGKSSYHLPQSQLQFNASQLHHMFMALENAQKYTSFLAKMVVIRTGDEVIR
jgi:hypothetical protein